MEHLVLRAVARLAPALSVFVRRSYERREQRLRLQRLRLELRMELAPDEVRVVVELHDLHVRSIRCRSRDAQPRAGEHGFVLAVELVAMTMALADLSLTV